MSTKLRLLLDECTQEPLAEAIKECGGILSVEAITATHPLGNKATTDKELVDYANENKRILDWTLCEVGITKRFAAKLSTNCVTEGKAAEAALRFAHDGWTDIVVSVSSNVSIPPDPNR